MGEGGFVSFEGIVLFYGDVSFNGIVLFSGVGLIMTGLSGLGT
jgi:hypothetical protein